MDSEGSELDDLADLDLATFSTPEREANFPPKDTELDGGRSTETEGDSLGDSMDSRASSEMSRSHEFSLDGNANGHNDSMFTQSTNLFLTHMSPGENYSVAHSTTLSSSNPFSPENLRNSGDQPIDCDFDSHGVVESSGVNNLYSGVPAPGRPGFLQQSVLLKRLPGENLGMVLAIEGDQDNRRPVEAVLVRSITPGGAAARAGDGSGGIQVGDEVREVDGSPLTELTHDQCIDLFQTMPDDVMLTVHRANQPDQLVPGGDLSAALSSGLLASKASSAPQPRPRANLPHSKISTSETDVVGSAKSTPRYQEDEGFLLTPRGFVKLDVTVFRGEEDSLGLSIIPSHGATCDLYQVKRLLPGGACAESGCLEVHDRLLYCNGLSLKGLTQAQCLQVLKSSGHFVELTVLRQIDGGSGQHVPTGEEGQGAAVGGISSDSLNYPTKEIASGHEIFSEAAEHSTWQAEPHVSDHLLIFEGRSSDSPDSLDLLSNQGTDGVSSYQFSSQRDFHQSSNSVTADFPGEEEKAESGYEHNEESDQLLLDLGLGSSLNETSESESHSGDLLGAIISLANETETEASGNTCDPEIGVSVQEANVNPSYVGYSLIPPPLQFSDGSGAQSLDEHHSESPVSPKVGDERQSECITNIDDILFDVSDSGTVNNTSSNFWLPEGRQNPEQQAAATESFTGNTVEEFAEQCFNNLESYGACEDSSFFEEENLDGSEVVGKSVPESFSLDVQSAPYGEENPAEVDIKSHITTISVSTTASLSRSPHSDNVTNIFVPSPAAAEVCDTCIEKIPAATNDTNVSNIHTSTAIPDTLLGVEKRENSVTNTEIRQLFSSCLPLPAMMSGETPSDSAIHTTLGVVTRVQNGQDEELIQPMAAIKNDRGKVFVVQKKEESPEPSDGKQQRDEDITGKIADVFKTMDYVPKPQASKLVEAAVSQEPELEEEIVPVKLNRAQTETVVNVLKNWTNVDAEPDDKISLQDVVAHFKNNKSGRPENAAVVHTIGVSGTGSDDEVIQPMRVTKDHQGKSYFVPVSGIEVDKKQEAPAVDETARDNLALIMANMATPALPAGPDTVDSTEGDLVEEENVVPVALKPDQKAMVMSFVDNLSRKEIISNESEDAVVVTNGIEGSNSVAEQNPRPELEGSNEPTNSEHIGLTLETLVTEVNDAGDGTLSHTGLAVDGEEIVRASSVISVQCTPKLATENVSTVVVQDNIASPTESKKSEGFLSAVRTFESGAKEQSPRPLPTALRPKVKESADVHSVVSKFEKPDHVTHSNEQVVMRPKTTRSTDFRAKIESFQAQENAAAGASKTFVSSSRPKSMVEVSSSSSSSADQVPLSKVDEIRKSFNAEPRSSLRPLSTLRPLSVSGTDTRRVSTGSRPFSGGTSALSVDTRRVSTGSRPFSGGMFSGSRSPRANLPHSRQADGTPFQVDVLKGILGLGLKAKVTPEGHVKVTEIQKGGPIEKDGQVRVGDFVQSINSTEVTGQSEVRVQQIIRLLPRGLVKLVVSSASPGSCLNTAPHESEETEHGDVGTQSSQAADSRDNSTAGDETSTHTFLLSGNSVEHISSIDGQSLQETGELSLPISSAESTTDGSPGQAPLTARVEISSSSTNSSSGGKQLAAPLKIAIKPTPTPRPSPHAMTKALAPRSPGLPSMRESVESSKEEPRSLSRDLGVAPKLSQRLHAADRTSHESDKKRSLSSGSYQNTSGLSSFKNNREMFEQKSSIKDMPALKPKTSLRKDSPASPSTRLVSLSNSVESLPKTESESVSLSLGTQRETDSDQLLESAEADSQSSQAQVQETLASTDSTDADAEISKDIAARSSLSPVQKTPPPVAPKPRLGSSSSTKSGGSFEETEDTSKTKTGPKISSGYERLQAITKSSKPSKIIEKSRTFVSSKAKMFDSKTEEANPPTTPEAVGRRISVAAFAQQDGGSSPINTSLKPLSERRKSTGSGLATKPLTLTQQFSAAPKPNARALSPAKRPTEIIIPEASPRDNASPDGRIKSVVSPTRLNSALSPRRNSSVDSPLSPSMSFSPKHVTSSREREIAGDKYPGSSPSTKEQSGTFKYSSVTVQGFESHANSSPRSPAAPSPSLHSQTSHVSSKSLTSPVSPPSFTSPVTSQVSEQHLENTMKMFDDLLMDTPVVHSETDPVDLLLWAPVRTNSPRSPRTDDSHASGDKLDPSQRKAPVAKPRSKQIEENLKPTSVETNNATPTAPKEKEVSNVRNILDPSEQPALENNLVALQISETLSQQSAPKEKQLSDVQGLLSSSNAKDLENIVAVQVSESIMVTETPKEKERIEVQSLLSKEMDNDIQNNIVAAQVAEKMGENRLNTEKQVFDAHDKLMSLPENNLQSNIIATEVLNNMVEISPVKQKQTLDTEAILHSELQSGVAPTNNIVAMQLSENLEINVKEPKSTESVTSVLENINNNNIVAEELSKEILVDTSSALESERHRFAETEEQDPKEKLSRIGVERDSTAPAPVVNAHVEDGMYREHAQKIVEDVIAKVTSDSTVENKPNESQSHDVPGEDDEEEPPPLPGAPPPPLILRNPVMLVSEQDLLDQGGAPVVPEGFSNTVYQQDLLQNTSETSPVSETVESSVKRQVVVDTNELINFETPKSIFHIPSSGSPSTEMASSADSVEPLNSTGGSVSESESHRFANSRSPDDMLSEDSGMPADEEFQEGATDDAISPPGEFAETVLVLRSANNDALLSPTQTASTEESVVKAGEPFAASSLMTTEVIPVVQVCDNDEDLAPPLPPTSQPLIAVEPFSSVEFDISSPQVSLENSSSLLSSQENTSNGVEEVKSATLGLADFTSGPEVVVNEEKLVCVQEISVSQTQLSLEAPSSDKEKAISCEVSSESVFGETSDSPGEGNVSQLPGKESVSSEGTDNEEVCSVQSRRKWCFRSNSAPVSTLVQAEAGTSSSLTFTEPSVVSVLPPSGLASLLEKANSILDKAEDSSDSLELIVVHLNRQADSRELGVDLKHDGGIWFKVSRVLESSPAKAEGGIELGDWLLAVDSLWCDQVTVMRLLARLTKPKRDSVLVLARGERASQLKQNQEQSAQATVRPTPLPRPRSSFQESQDVSLSNEVSVTSNDKEQSSVVVKPDSAVLAPELPSNPLPLEVSPQQSKSSGSSSDQIQHSLTEFGKSSSSVYSTTVTAELQVVSTESPQDASKSSHSQAENSSTGEASVSGVFKVVMMKGATGVGFCLEGGKGSPKGDVPIIIKRIFKGGPAEKCGQLKVKDEILEVNGVDFRSMRHYEAWNHLKFLDDGEVCITVRRDEE